jgi:tellurite resistance protein TehA-like permease
MFGSYYAEIAVGLGFLAAAVLLLRYLHYAFRHEPLPLLLRGDMAAQLSAVLEVALLAFGAAALIDAAAKAVS